MASEDGVTFKPPASIGRAEAIGTTGAQPAAARPAADAGGAWRERIAADRLGAKGADGRSAIDKAVERIAARGEGRERPIPTPWRGVNDALGGGVWPGFHVLVGGTGAGKSQWALDLAIGAATEHGIPVLYLALELDTFGMVCRALAADVRARLGGGPQWSALYTGAAAREGMPAGVPDAADALRTIPFHVIEADAHGFAHDQLADALDGFRALYPREAHPRALVVLDFLQLMGSPEGAREDLRERIGRAAYQCRIAARKHNVAVVALSSTARRPANDNPLVVTRDEQKAPRRAAFHELVGLGKESGDVEYSADSVMVMCREPWDAPPPADRSLVHLAVAKLRAGVAAWCALRFDGTTFTDATVEASAAPGAKPSRPASAKPSVKPSGRRGPQAVPDDGGDDEENDR